MALTTTSAALSPARSPSSVTETDARGFSRPLMPLWLALVAAVGAGIAFDAGFPDKGWWPLTLVATGVILTALVGRRPGAAFLVGLVAGGVFWAVHIFWLTLYLGPVPWLGLFVFEALYFALGSLLISLVYRRADRTWPSRWGRLGVVPVVVAGLWTLREGINSIFPWGGFSWGRVAMSQSESPYTSLVAWVGMAGLSFVLVWLMAFLLQLVRESGMRAATRILTAAVAVVATLAVPAWPAPTSGTSRIGAVQGNSDAGLFSQHAPGDILSDHASGSAALVGEDLDVLVWPENASDLDPETYPIAAATLDAVSAELGGVPIVAGTIQQRGDKVYNTSLLWQNGAVTDFYDKRHPVPFAEWMPERAFFRALAPDLVDLVTRDYEFGSTDLTFDIDGLIAGISICFDITDDAVMRAMSAEGAQVVFAQTNNADFGQTDENLQQLAITRLRAVEFGRSVVNISTVGTSEIIAPDGSTIAAIPPYQAGAMVADVPLATVQTPASLIGFQVEWLVAGLGLAGLALALSTRRVGR
ncbi:apolipoprotein N-acyltransferase [Herbiconiux moechotypicola]|uniref:Apolipoprotein N-acyltransferase n=1 Tax=Herbiconiux moechotypicola TaxID=637393 RepID=A0ABP5R1F8_9MICO|nr:apolipoprotein N-acyltransferase [Herbiconiux moechotypicola]MCS5731301.1 apolipoprotein N-acyltransferase [Herbiconiux moechotypicola]